MVSIYTSHVFEIPKYTREQRGIACEEVHEEIKKIIIIEENEKRDMK